MTLNVKEINLDNFILPSYKKLFYELINFEYLRAVIKGGRSSGKSVLISILIVVGTLTHKRSALCVLSTKVDVQKRLDNVINKTIDMLGLKDYFRYVTTKHTFILLDSLGNDTDVEIVCTGCDDPERLKGVSAKRGSFWALWCEEATNFKNIKQIKNIESSVGRGDLKHFVSIISYNPRQNSSHFLNKEYENISDDIISRHENKETHGSKLVTSCDFDLNDEISFKFKQVIFHCTYKSIIKYGHVDWISPTDLVDIQRGERDNSEYYRWYYLGEVVGSANVNVFRNIAVWDGDFDKINITKIYRGLDVGNGGEDPWHYIEVFFNKKNMDLYILREFRDKGGDNIIDRVADGIKHINKLNMQFYIDSAVPTFASLLRNKKLNPLAVKKIPGSVDAGILWLQNLHAIYICKATCPHTFKEFSEYEYIIDKYEEITSELPDKDNHSIDAVRYACNMLIRSIA